MTICPCFKEIPDLTDVVKYAVMVEEHGHAWRAYVENFGAANTGDDGFNERFTGPADSERD